MFRSVLSGLGATLAALPVLADTPTPSAIAALAAGHDVILLGEVHDNPAHHLMQASVLWMLEPAAVVFEMLDPEEAQVARSTLASGAVADLAARLDWANSGWPEFSYYAPLFALAADLPIYGAEVPRDAAQRAFAQGAADVFGQGAARFQLTEPLPEAQQVAREAGQMAVHCNALPPEILPRFVEAQRLRDAVLAAAALEALEESGAPVVVITGNGHARRDWGVPALIAQAAPAVTVFALGQLEGEVPADAPFDLIATAPAVERPDPCAAFR